MQSTVQSTRRMHLTVKRPSIKGMPSFLTVRSLDFGFVAESHPRDVDFHFVTREKSEGSNERGSADSDEELPVLQASDGEDDNERGERPGSSDTILTTATSGDHTTHTHTAHIHAGRSESSRGARAPTNPLRTASMMLARSCIT